MLWASCLPQAPSHGCLSARVRWKEKWRQNALPTASPTNPREGQAAAWVGVEECRRCCAAQDPSWGDEVAAPSPARAARESRAAQGMRVCIHREAAVHPGTRERWFPWGGDAHGSASLSPGQGKRRRTRQRLQILLHFQGTAVIPLRSPRLLQDPVPEPQRLKSPRGSRLTLVCSAKRTAWNVYSVPGKTGCPPWAPVLGRGWDCRAAPSFLQRGQQLPSTACGYQPPGTGYRPQPHLPCPGRHPTTSPAPQGAALAPTAPTPPPTQHRQGHTQNLRSTSRVAGST